MRLQRSVITPTGGVPTPLNLPVRPLRTVACGGRSRPGLKRALALDLLANGREPVVHKVHVDNRGGQAVIADTVQTPGGGGEDMDNPLHSKAWALHRAPRCGVRTRSRKPCQSPAMPNGRCRMHGGPSPGAPKGNRNAWKHEARSASTIEALGIVRALARLAIDVDRA